MNALFKRYAAIFGWDWADKKHDVCLLDKSSSQLTYQVIEHKVNVIEEWVISLQKKYPNGRFAICIELSCGPIVHALLKYDCIDIYPVNPGTLASYRNVFRPSKAKDDASDAYLQLDFLLNHHEKLRMLKPDTPELRELNQLVVQRRGFVDQKVRITNQITAMLKSYFPLVLQWFEAKDTLLFCDFIERWPTLSKLQRSREKTIETFFRERRSYSYNVIEKRLDLLKSAIPLTKDEGVINPSAKAVLANIKLLRELIHIIADYDKSIQVCCKTLNDFKIFSSLPGAGSQMAPRLLAAFGSQRDKFNSSDEMARYSGIAPVTVASGQSRLVKYRHACPKFLRQTFVEWANQSKRHSFWANAFYNRQREKGKGHQTAIRALAFKWIRIVFRLWKNKETYDESKYLMALQSKESPLLGGIST